MSSSRLQTCLNWCCGMCIGRARMLIRYALAAADTRVRHVAHLLASCCRVDVMKGGAGLRLVSLLLMLLTCSGQWKHLPASLHSRQAAQVVAMRWPQVMLMHRDTLAHSSFSSMYINGSDVPCRMQP